MKSIVYIGYNETAIKLEQAYKKKYAEEIELQPFYADQASKKDVLNVIYDDNEEIKGAIINVDELGSLSKELMDIVNDVLSKSDIKLCLLCCGRMKDDDLVLEALECGVQYLMLYPGIAHNAKVIENIIEGVPNISEVIYGKPTAIPTPAAEKKPKIIKNISSNSKDKDATVDTQTISVGACLPRMGATTFAIQLIKYFHSQGLSACYIDSSESTYMKDFLLVYEEEGKLDESHSRFTLDGIDFYYRFYGELWNYITDMNYDYIVFDMGHINTEDKINSFTNTNYHILCTGSKANEFKAMGDLLSKLYSTNTIYSFYSVPKAQIKSIQEACNQNNQKCCFIPYIDDEFILQKDTSEIFYNIFY